MHHASVFQFIWVLWFLCIAPPTICWVLPGFKRLKHDHACVWSYSASMHWCASCSARRRWADLLSICLKQSACRPLTVDVCANLSYMQLHTQKTQIPKTKQHEALPSKLLTLSSDPATSAPEPTTTTNLEICSQNRKSLNPNFKPLEA